MTSAQLPAAAGRELTQHHGEHRATHGRRRVRGEVPVAHLQSQWAANHRLVCREVGCRDEAAALGGVRRDPLGQLSGVDGPVALFADEVEGVGKIGRAHEVAGVQGRPVRPAHQRARVLVPPEDGVGRDREEARRRGTDVVAGPQGGGGRRQDVGPSGRAVALVREAERREGAGGRHRAVTGIQGDPAPVVHVHLEEPRSEPFRGLAAARHLDVAVDDLGLAPGRPDADEGATEGADDAGLGAHGRDHRGDGGIDGIPTCLNRGEAGMDGHGPGRGNRHLSVHAAIVPCRGPVRVLLAGLRDYRVVRRTVNSAVVPSPRVETPRAENGSYGEPGPRRRGPWRAP